MNKLRINFQSAQFILLLYFGQQSTHSEEESRIVYDPYEDRSLEEITLKQRRDCGVFPVSAGKTEETFCAIQFGSAEHKSSTHSVRAYLTPNKYLLDIATTYGYVLPRCYLRATRNGYHFEVSELQSAEA